MENQILEELRKLNLRFDSFEKRMDNLERKVDNLENKVDNLEKRMSNLEKKVDVFQDCLMKSFQEMGKLEEKMVSKTEYNAFKTRMELNTKIG